jgi:hypothetical protein
LAWKLFQIKINMYGPFKISHHQFSGRLRPHEHTSYLPLAFLVLVVGVALMLCSVSAYADHPPPQAGSVSLSGTVPAPPPKTAATISSPSNQQRFSSTPITVSGSCPTETLIEIFKNDIFAGSTPCSSTGSYSLQIDLLFGQNTLTAQVYDALNQAGPVSSPVTVFYDYSPAQASASSFLNFSGAQLLLNSDAAYRGIFPNQQLNVPITVIGGTPPFAVNVQWGDSTNQIIPESTNTTFNASHIYKKAGTYRITIQASDSKQLVAFLTVAAIVNGQPALAASGNLSTPASTNKLLVLWPAFAIAVTALASFWIGERREKHLLRPALQGGTPTFGMIPHAST